MKNRLRVLRAEQDWTQEELAEKLGVTRQAIIAIEKGKYDPSLDLAFRISKVFGQPLEMIFIPDSGHSDEDISDERQQSGRPKLPLGRL